MILAQLQDFHRVLSHFTLFFPYGFSIITRFSQGFKSFLCYFTHFFPYDLAQLHVLSHFFVILRCVYPMILVQLQVLNSALSQIICFLYDFFVTI